jgi:hypothetical protein
MQTSELKADYIKWFKQYDFKYVLHISWIGALLDNSVVCKSNEVKDQIKYKKVNKQSRKVLKIIEKYYKTKLPALILPVIKHHEYDSKYHAHILIQPVDYRAKNINPYRINLLLSVLANNADCLFEDIRTEDKLTVYLTKHHNMPKPDQAEWSFYRHKWFTDQKE